MQLDSVSENKKLQRLRPASLLLITSFFLAIAILASPAAAFQAAPTIAWKFEVGDRLAVSFEQSNQIETLIDTRDRKLENLTVLSVDWDVTDVAENGNATISQTIESIRIKSGAPGEESKKTVDIDSAQTDVRYRGISKEAMKLVQPLIGLRFEIVLSPQNELLDFTVPAETATALATFATDAKLIRNLSATSLQTMVANAAMKLPSDPVKVDDSWQESNRVAFAGRTFERTANFSVSQADEAAVHAAIKLEFAESQQNAVAATNSGSESTTGPLQLLDHAGDGKLIFDRQSGIVSSIELQTEMKTRVMYRDDAVTTTIKSTQKLNVTRK